MTEEQQASQADPKPARQGPLDKPTRQAAIGLLVVFVVAMAIMFLLRGDPNWDRMVYLYSGLEAVVFAAAGALFGTTVQRGAVTVARTDAERAQTAADQARQEAKDATQLAARGKALASTVKAAGDEELAAPNGRDATVRHGARPGEEPTDAPPNGTASTVRTLARVAADLFPDD